MREPSHSILLIAAKSVADGVQIIEEKGLRHAQGLGRTRVVTEPLALRGWRDGTLVFWRTIGAGRHAQPDLSDVMIDTLHAMIENGRFRVADDADVRKFRNEVLA